MGRRRFTPEFKLEAVKLVKERGVVSALIMSGVTDFRDPMRSAGGPAPLVHDRSHEFQ
jgi:hypothetical protein